MKNGLTVLLLIACIVHAAQARDATGPLQSVQRGADGRDTLLAALGEATLDCLGSVSTRHYRVNSARMLERTFSECGTRDAAALERIDRLLGVQNSREGQQDGLSQRFAQVWAAAVRSFPARTIQECPSWELMHVIDAPTEERVAHFAAQAGAASIGKEYRWYKVSSPQCGSSGLCAVWHAVQCGAGFSDQFIVWVDPTSSSVIVDPAWWNTTYEYPDDCNPFMCNGTYRHGMSYYGKIPGALYGSIERAGETCTKWSEIAQKHYFDATLVSIDCGGGWHCMSYCAIN